MLQLPDCETFAAASQGFIDSVEDYQITVLNVETGEDQITVETSRDVHEHVDHDGNPTEEPVEYEDRYAYSVVPSERGLGHQRGDRAELIAQALPARPRPMRPRRAGAA